MPTEVSDRSSVDALLKLLGALGIREAQRIMKVRGTLSQSSMVAALKELYSQDVITDLVFKDNLFLRLLPKDNK